MKVYTYKISDALLFSLSHPHSKTVCLTTEHHFREAVVEKLKRIQCSAKYMNSKVVIANISDWFITKAEPTRPTSIMGYHSKDLCFYIDPSYCDHNINCMVIASYQLEKL